MPNTEKATVASASMREELSSIFFEIHYETLREVEMQGMYAWQSQAREEVETLCEEDEDEHGDTLCGACGKKYASDEFWICCNICCMKKCFSLSVSL
ncbi:PHD finger protein ALFIN-LIKE 3-like isoform X2 [Cucumis melo var. makuwa]|uniref:PHD finger protein ALFIN-LIKE 3-like isoform X2 n=3 Tax=Cucumis melo TaxID=3656 RepID=A0A5D3C2E9_CUCMM|nr:PHD finger protein ALFIN-LIKE 3-like isoform X2 [Cucumis melo var. makuwa]TYK04569.1 PHD finger protein ALFIN-LIKE 3-like isoform X2 [Cucumis melo var. makuwa]